MDTPEGVPASLCHYLNFGGDLNMSVRNEIKAQIIRAGFTIYTQNGEREGDCLW